MFYTGALFPHLFRHKSARILLDSIDAVVPLKSICAARCLTTGGLFMEDRAGRRITVDANALLRLARDFVNDQRSTRRLIAAAEIEVGAMEAVVRRGRQTPAFSRPTGAVVLYLDFHQHAAPGGGTAHLNGVLGEFRAKMERVDLVTASPVPAVPPGIATLRIPFRRRAWINPELHQLHANRGFLDALRERDLAQPGRLVYQRACVHNWTGAAFAWRNRLPFILEFNGSEPWIARHWARPLRFESLAARIEQLNLHAADLVTVVSKPLQQQLLQRGVREERILVNPNGVDPDRCRPDRDAAWVREQFGLRGECVIGFIGTFGPWHGSETLTRAFIELAGRRPDLSAKIRLLLIGDGVRLPVVRDLVAAAGRSEMVCFAGTVPWGEAPAYLAACDILVAPTEVNPDGSDFFGSPTKVFEYMATGRGIVAASVGQVAEVLKHERNALLVAPGRVDALAAAIERLVEDDELRCSLGAAARADAVAHHTWRRHVERLIAKLETLTG